MSSVFKENLSLKTLKTKLVFLSKLALSPRSYEIINEPLSDLSQLDTTLGTICYASLLLSVLLERIPQLELYLLRVKPRIIKIIKSLGIILLKRLLTAVKILLNSFQAMKSQFHSVSNVNKVTCTLDELITVSLGELDKASQQNPAPEVKIEKINSQHPNVDHLSTTLKQISGYISDVRTFYRTFQIPQAIADLLSAPGQLLSKGNYIDFLSTISICLYQPFETVAFGLDKGWWLPAPDGPKKCGWWYVVSTKMWFLWVVVEFGHDTNRLINALKNGYAIKGDVSSSRSELLSKAFANVDHTQWVTFIERLSTLPLCLHWSLEEGCLQPWQVGLFGTLAGGLSSTLIWKNVWKKILKPQ